MDRQLRSRTHSRETKPSWPPCTQPPIRGKCTPGPTSSGMVVPLAPPCPHRSASWQTCPEPGQHCKDKMADEAEASAPAPHQGGGQQWALGPSWDHGSLSPGRDVAVMHVGSHHYPQPATVPLWAHSRRGVTVAEVPASTQARLPHTGARTHQSLYARTNPNTHPNAHAC